MVKNDELRRKIERCVGRTYSPLTLEDEPLVQRLIDREMDRIMRLYVGPHKFKTNFWVVEGNWTTPRLYYEMNDPNANLHIMGIFRSRAGALEAVEKAVNNGEPAQLVWENIQQDEHLCDKYRARWIERCEGDLLMHCSAVVRTMDIGYMKIL